MDVTNTSNDLVTQFAATLQSRDAARLTQLKQASTLAEAETVASEAEQARLAKKYGAASAQANAAADRLTLLNLESAALSDSILRASIQAPSIDPGLFIVYGRVLDAQGKGVSGAKLTATATSGATLATATTKAQGIFELSVPLQPNRKTSKKTAEAAQATTTPLTFNVIVAAKGLQQPYISPEVLTGAASRVAYREITLPNG